MKLYQGGFNRYFALKIIVIFSLMSLGGCAGALRSYDGELKQTVGSAESGNFDTALASLETNNSKDKDLLYFLEKGELLRLSSNYPSSRDAWLLADEKVRVWEDEAHNFPEKLLGNVGSVLINDKTRRYDGRDYEKVFLSSRLALDHAILGDWENARVEIKKMHERESIISEFRFKEISDAEEKALKNGIATTFQDLKGYPVETLNDPEVINLKNSYQSAYGHYLAGFVYESLGESSLAAAGYRQAIELQPNIKLLQDALSNLDSRVNQNTGKTDVLVVVETGNAPSIRSMRIAIPVPLGNRIGVVPIAFPVITPDKNEVIPSSFMVDRQTIELDKITSVSAMARKALRDEMPGIIVRGSFRAISKVVAQKVAMDKDKSGVAALLLMIGGFVMEGADERTWRTLPANISISRMSLPEGNHEFFIQTSTGEIKKSVNISGKSIVVSMRLLGNEIYLSQSASIAQPSINIAVVAPSESSQQPVEESVMETKSTVIEDFNHIKKKPKIMSKRKIKTTQVTNSSLNL